MKRIFAILIRTSGKLYLKLTNILRITYLRLKYPGADIDFKSKIAKNCHIICVDGGTLKLRNTSLAPGTHLFADKGSRLEVYDSVIGQNCVIVAKDCIVINPGCAIAEMVVIRDQNHMVDTGSKTDVFSQYDTGKIEIHENVWIAAKATILKNVTIGKYAVIAASAVVTKDVPGYQIWAGIPAKFLKYVNQ
ncbi:hypothetical protein BEL04_07140 [Mucilaginibacter sp. PPCGB 2223]|uniref:acyltransferase n=1 Tax=Mucilaginibacter sp. PPCGB 2223 TaxID=1886027 RepID=UPI0008251CBA|nr:acyltransferase [Mucilaginibacter sp. PPCGB 2223]OCX54042.1 hypothetical protein BEL04_07140 [Mucilaginibacter sp. PPCGB 2223]